MNESKRYGVAVVGCGLMGTRWAEEVNKNPRLQLRLMMDAQLIKAQESAAKCKTNATDSFEDVLNHREVDIVVVAVRADRHHQISMALLKAGKHVMCEKPYSMKLDEIDQAIALCRDGKHKLRVGFMMRFLPGLTDLVNMIHNGELGRPLYFRHFLHQGGPDNWGYFESLIAAAGSPAADCGIHYMDIFQWLTGERINQVYSAGVRTESPDSGGPNLCQVTFKTPGGSVGWVEDCWTTVSNAKKQTEIIGPKASAEFHWEPDAITVALKRRGQSTPEILTWPPSSKPLGPEMQHFIDEIDHDRSVVPHLQDVRNATAAALAANESMRTGKVIHL